MLEQAISVERVTKHYGPVRALDGLDLSVRAGSVCAMLGPNGAGKTTAIRILSTLARPDSGRVTVLGHDVVHEPMLVRRAIGFAGQSAAVDDDLTGRENLVILGRMLHLGSQRARLRAEALLNQFNLVDAADRLVKTYSGGMRRRLDLIASFVTPRPVLLLDEPTTGLDPRSRNEIWETVRQLVADGTTVVLTTQYLLEADELADDVVIIDHGRAVATGSPEQLKADIGLRVDVEVAEAGGVASATAALAGLTGSEPVPDIEHLRISAALLNPALTIPTVVRYLDEAGVAIKDVGIRQPTLDEVFLRLTDRSVEESAA